MRITQGYVSKSIMDFPFHQIYKLSDYRSNKEPSVFFGMYRYEDYILAADYYDCGYIPKIFWTGQDALDAKPWMMRWDNITAHTKIQKLFLDKGYNCQLVPPASFLLKQSPQQRGKNIYAYCPSSASNYHGKKIIDELRCGGYDVTIGDGQFTQSQWRNGQADFYYKNVFIGLCLSEFAGGGLSILEMGLRGIKVVTNVFNLPNCLPWNSIQDVVTHIENESKNIGTTDEKLAQQVWESLDHEHKWLNL